MWRSNWIFISLILLMSIVSLQANASNPHTFTYQGDLYLSDGTPSNATVDFKFQIYDPSGTCLLYEEYQSGVNLSLTDGHFALSIGSPLASSKRTPDDPGLEMATIFSNAPVAIRNSSSPLCSSGYTPTSGDKRFLRVMVGNDPSYETLTPDQAINAVPYATVAETIQGLGPADFIQNTITNMQSLVEDLVNGTSNLYLRADGSNTVAPVPMNNQRITSVADPVNPQDAATKNYTDTRLGGQSISAGVPADGQVLVWNSTTNQWEASSPTDITVQAHARAVASPCSAGQASSWNGTAWSCVAASGGGGGGATNGGALHTGTFEEIVLTSAHDKNHATNYSEGVVFKLPDATTMGGTGGPFYSIFNNNSNSNLNIPVTDVNGKFITAIAPGNKKDFYLFDNSNPAGVWQTENVNSLASGVAKLDIGATSSTYSNGNTRFGKFPGTNTYILASMRGDGLWVNAGTVDHANMTVSWGSEVGISTITSGNLDIQVLDASRAAIFYGSSPYNSMIVNLSGNTLTPNAESTGLPSCYNYKALSPTTVTCQGSGSCGTIPMYKLDASGVTISNAGSANIPTGSCTNGNAIERIDDTQAVIFYGLSGTGLLANHLDISSWTFGPAVTLTADSNYSLYTSGNGYIEQSSVYDISATEFLLTASSGYNNIPQKIYRMGISGNSLSVLQTADVAPHDGMGNSARFFEISSVLYVSADGTNASNSQRRVVTDPTNLTFGPLEKSYECYGHYYAIGKCLKGQNYGGFPDGINRPGLAFEIGH